MSPRVRLVEGGVGVLDVAWPDVLPVAVNRVLLCVTRPHNLLGVEDNGLELVHRLLGNRTGDGFLRRFKP